MIETAARGQPRGVRRLKCRSAMSLGTAKRWRVVRLAWGFTSVEPRTSSITANIRRHTMKGFKTPQKIRIYQDGKWRKIDQKDIKTVVCVNNDKNGGKES